MVLIWVIVALLALVYLKPWTWRSNKKLLPGPRGFPIFGSLNLLGKFPHKDLHQLARKYGDIMHIRLGLVPVIVVSSPRAAELFLKTHDLVFASRPPHQGAKHIAYDQTNLTFAEYGSYWRDMRKIILFLMMLLEEGFRGKKRSKKIFDAAVSESHFTDKYAQFFLIFLMIAEVVGIGNLSPFIIIMNKLHSKVMTFHHKAYQLERRVSTHLIHGQSKLESNLVLKQLSISGRIDDARQVFDEMPSRDEFSWNTMIAAYANSGRVAEAKQVFDAAPSKTAITWSSLISGYCRSECPSEAFRLFWQMQLEGERPSLYTLGSLLRLCSKLGFLQRGEMVHGYMVKTRFDSNVDVVTGLLDMYAKCKRIFEAECLFESLRDRRNHVVWTVMLTGYSQNGDGFKAMEFFRDMRAQGVESNQFTFPSVLTASASVLALSFGAQVHGCIVHSGFGPNVFVQSALVDVYVKCGDHVSARKVLRSMEVDDVVSWNSMIVGCVRQGFMREALSLFRELRSREMMIDDYTYPSVLNSFAALKEAKNAVAIHCLIVKTGFEVYQLVGNALVDMYAKLGNIESAVEMFRHMPDKDVISWTSLVAGYAQNGSHEKALILFCEMRDAGIYPDQFVIASILSACAELTLLEFGQQIHANYIKSGLQASLSVDNSFVTMYAKCGCLEEAHRVFDSMQVQNVITWTALIVGYAQNGRGKKSLEFYDQMLATGTQPDFITFIGLLFACSHAGLLEKGQYYFESMNRVYRIKPGPEHYACMIDLLGRSGKLNEAEALVDQMAVEPDGTVWKALLAACRVHGKIELGERAAENLFILEPKNAVPYVQLSNMYSAAGRWEDAARIRRLMKSKGILKEPGCSWIEMNGQVHTFMSEDRSHSWTTEVYFKIDEIMMFIKEAGYVPDMNFALHDMDKEGKELGLAYHSEKLAVAFGLLTTSPGAPIRIFKNLRVCGDCHTAMKYISQVYLRHIILRDSNCFHHFKEGKCSCDDYW